MKLDCIVKVGSFNDNESPKLHTAHHSVTKRCLIFYQEISIGQNVGFPTEVIIKKEVFWYIRNSLCYVCGGRTNKP